MKCQAYDGDFKHNKHKKEERKQQAITREKRSDIRYLSNIEISYAIELDSLLNHHHSKFYRNFSPFAQLWKCSNVFDGTHYVRFMECEKRQQEKAREREREGERKQFALQK